MSIFDKWNQSVDTEGLAKDVKAAEESGGGTYVEVPVGRYEVEINKMELKESKAGKPMFTCWMKILKGDYKNSLLFYNAVITQGFQIGQVNKFLRGLDALDQAEIEFKDYSQYNDLIMDIREAIEDYGLAYVVDFEKVKDFPKYTIEDVFEK